MIQRTKSDPGWRLDPGDRAPRLSGASRIPTEDPVDGSPCSVGLIARWAGHAARWASRFLHTSGLTAEEGVVSELATALLSVEDQEAAIRSLISALESITGACSIEWIPEVQEACDSGEEGNPVSPDRAISKPDEIQAAVKIDRVEQGILEISLRVMHRVAGRIRVNHPSSAQAEWPPATMARMNTLCTIAVLTLRRFSGPGQLPLEEPSLPDVPCHRLTPVGLSGVDGNADAQECAPFPSLQDATFLNAVLPFALCQARRHGESLSLLCVAIDRLGGIRELMGSEAADRAARSVGQQIAGMIRSSDIVSRIDDDRIIAVLPRAALDDSLCLAERICRTVESRCARQSGLPVLTVSIGVAEFPSCASTVYDLLDAADHAQFMAQRTGRNRAVLARRLDAPGAMTGNQTKLLATV